MKEVYIYIYRERERLLLYISIIYIYILILASFIRISLGVMTREEAVTNVHNIVVKRRKKYMYLQSLFLNILFFY
jgi:hypothetical protein